MDTEAFIRDRAKLGWSREMTRQALNMSDCKFRQILSVLPDVEWPAINKSVARQEFYRSQRGHCSENRRAILEKSWASRRANAKKVQIGSVSGTVAEQLRLWGEFISVSQSQVSRRLARGWPVYDAFFLRGLPRQVNSTDGEQQDDRIRSAASAFEENGVDRQSQQEARECILAMRVPDKPRTDRTLQGRSDPNQPATFEW